MENHFVKMENLSVGFSLNYPILKDLTYSINRGEVIAITGRNGSGKTTLVRTIAGLLKPLGGNLRKARDLRISMVPQIKKMSLSYPLSVEKILAMPEESEFFFPFKRHIFTDEQLSLLNEFGVLDYKKKLLRECSGGQIQKVLLLRSLIGRANLLILDEPLDALDESTKYIFMNYIKGRIAKSNLTILLITHHLEETWMQNFTRCLSLMDGRMEESEHGKCNTIH